MTAYVKLGLMDVDSFCNSINVLRAEVVALEEDKKIYIKSLISLLKLDLIKEICMKINSADEKELNLFEKIIKRYGGRVCD